MVLGDRYCRVSIYRDIEVAAEEIAMQWNKSVAPILSTKCLSPLPSEVGEERQRM